MYFLITCKTSLVPTTSLKKSTSLRFGVGSLLHMLIIIAQPKQLIALSKLTMFLDIYKLFKSPSKKRNMNYS